jgi:E3 ubiquitin-protein ligase MARCH6
MVMVMPYIMRYIRPSKALRPWIAGVWQITAHSLRLSSYLLGHSDVEEQRLPWWRQLDAADPEAKYGEYRRVPATDAVTVSDTVRLVVTVNADGTPLDEAGQRMLEAQDAAATQAGRDPNKDYIIVFVPPQFKLRLFAFLADTWIMLSAIVALSIAIPVILGRVVIETYVKKPVHDGYTFVVGFCLLGLGYAFGRALHRMDIRRQRLREWEGPRAMWGLWELKCVLHWTGTMAYMLAALGVVVPILLGLAVELYVILPLRLAITPDLPIRIRVADMWMLGLLYTKMLSRSRAVRGNDFQRGMSRVSTRSSYIAPASLTRLSEDRQERVDQSGRSQGYHRGHWPSRRRTRLYAPCACCSRRRFASLDNTPHRRTNIMCVHQHRHVWHRLT